jgi:hypothetical protein
VTYEILSATSARKEPRFGASPVHKLDAGTKVIVLAMKGDWLEIQSKQGGPSVFVRKEYATPVANIEDVMQ